MFDRREPVTVEFYPVPSILIFLAPLLLIVARLRAAWRSEARQSTLDFEHFGSE